MGKTVWLVTGNKGGAGKSALAKLLIEWLKGHRLQVRVADGDARTPDVAQAFRSACKVWTFDLNDEDGWPAFADWLYGTEVSNGHVVTNLPDGISERALRFLHRFRELGIGCGWRIRVLFVMSNLPDGLPMFARLERTFPDVLPIKNLHFGKPSSFADFDHAFPELADQCALFPALSTPVMTAVRQSNLPYAEFATQRGNSRTNISYHKAAVAQWQVAAWEALDDFLLGDDL